jgi:hypothetical protein
MMLFNKPEQICCEQAANSVFSCPVRLYLKTWNKFTSPYVDFPFLIGSKNPGIARLANDKLCGHDSS